MTWQEELRKLDEDLAAGKISADDYRVRRDQVLSSAVSPNDQQDQTPANRGDSDNAGATQVIHPVTPQGGNQPQQSFAVRQPWNAPEQDVRPPWGGDLPPTAHQESPWVSQGPESSESASSGGKGRKALLSAIGVVVVLGLCVAVWALFIRPGASGNTSAAAPPPSQQRIQQPPASTQPPLPEPPAVKDKPADNAAALVKPEGEPRDGGGEFDLDSLRERKLLPEPVIAALDKAGMTGGLLSTTKAGESIVGLYSLEVESEQAARTVAHEYAIAQQEGGLPAARGLSLKGVPVFGTSTGDNPVYRAVYVVYDRVIVAGVYGKDAQSVTDLFSALLDKQVSHAPPTVREPF